MKEIIYEADNYQIHTYKLRKYKHSTIRIYLTRPYKKERAAVSLLLRNLLLYSTKKLKHEEFVKELGILYSPSIGIRGNRVGEMSVDQLTLNFLNPKYCEPGYLRKLLNLFKDVIYNPNIKNNKFNEEYLEVIKTRVINNIRQDIEDPAYLCRKKALEAMDKDSLSSYTITEEEIMNVTQEDLINEYSRMFEEYEATAYVVGNVNTKQIANFIAKNFKFKKHNYDKKLEYFNKVRDEVLDKEEVGDYLQQNIRMIFNIDMEYKNPKMRYVVPLIYNTILGDNGLKSRLFISIREKNSLCYACRSMVSIDDHLLSFAAGINGSKKKVVKLVNKEIEKMNEGKITKKEINNAIKTRVDILKETKQEIGNIIYYNFYHNFTGEPDIDERIELFKSVTVEDLVEFGKHLKLNTVFLLKGDDNSGKN